MKKLLLICALALPACATSLQQQYDRERADMWSAVASAAQAVEVGDHDAVVADLAEARQHLRVMHEINDKLGR